MTMALEFGGTHCSYINLSHDCIRPMTGSYKYLTLAGIFPVINTVRGHWESWVTLGVSGKPRVKGSLQGYVNTLLG